MTKQKLEKMGFSLYIGGWIYYGTMSVCQNSSKLTEKQLINKLYSEVWKEASEREAYKISDTIKKALKIR
jgi:hypothetical protein